MKNTRRTTRLAAACLAGFALVGSGSAVAMAAPAPAPATAPAPAEHSTAQDPQFAYGVHVTMINETRSTLNFGTYTIKPGERATVSNGSSFGRDIVTSYSYDGGQRYGVEAKNPSFGYPWIKVANSGERGMGERTSFTTEFDGHKVEVWRDGDRDGGWKQFTIYVKA
ncbi:MAG: hypothetical protein U0R64_06790 [Candidatus Nanopelagicales bacterium]